ncbi:RNA-guided pseudouridylation complex pseudouridine synthase subunit Cbf5 [Candidatus Woesearchaeota archaeon]|nr:RNA-guided pseudouridylation complex pseudouridine synthase subunit Cbf5 [Candidatus Woesearchaeota archaeon]
MQKLPFEKIKREIIAKKQAKSNPEYGCKPEKRPVDELIDYGIINLDKPKGPTSHQVSDYVQRILKINKSGHSGTLDPAVTGILPIATGRATRIVQTLLKAGKEYIGIMHLHKEINEKTIKKVCKEFVGKIKQLPPIKSAVKRVEREREIYYFEILEINGKDVLFRVGAEAGTYIRKLCFDIGKRLGIGAHMAELRRTKVGPFDEKKNLVTLQDLADAYWFWKNKGNEKYVKYCIQPIETAVSHLAKIWVMDSAVNSLCHGADLKIPGVVKFESGIKKEESVAVMTLKNELIAIGTAQTISEDIKKKDKGMVVKIHKVFMKPGNYPKIEVKK